MTPMIIEEPMRLEQTKEQPLDLVVFPVQSPEVDRSVSSYYFRIYFTKWAGRKVVRAEDLKNMDDPCPNEPHWE